MLWTTTSLYIQIVAGFVGAHLAAVVVHDHAFGFWGHTAVGLIAGAVGGYFFQTLSVTVVTGSGSLNELRPADIFVLQAGSGAAFGGICMLAVGMLLAPRIPPRD
ncbi:hypothetical protein UP10_33185 [Bradyrhizobium sp. LTSPM299]|uniref:hypothetical protein n=1 Tax=Bradyrhizobium sp. LTSPM299 TaxID=1619233 RepID=UPI0005C8849A|nr:hypothetical protein [Bradyrhizobium sp. LTSPM299]KJC56783.1 hypothetical protein UP10_33185 [Bradyrhizobium sp. LTSPM299]